MKRVAAAVSELTLSSQNQFSILATTVPEIDTNSEQLHIPVKLIGRNREKQITAMVDSGASTLFLSKEFVRKNHVRTARLAHAIPLYNIDGTHNKMGDITHVAELGLQIGEHVEERAIFTVADIGPEDLIIGIDWLRKHNPEIDWKEGQFTLDCCEEPEPVRSKVKPRIQKKKVTWVKLKDPEEEELGEDHQGAEAADLVPIDSEGEFEELEENYLLDVELRETLPIEMNHLPARKVATPESSADCCCLHPEGA